MGEVVRILIVEDEAIPCMSLGMLLRREGFEICGCAVSGPQAIAMALQESPDIVLMDITLRGAMNGIEAARQICERGSSLIIFLTGYVGGSYFEQAAALEPLGYFTKPLCLPRLLDTIRTAFPHVGAQ